MFMEDSSANLPKTNLSSSRVTRLTALQTAGPLGRGTTGGIVEEQHGPKDGEVSVELVRAAPGHSRSG